MFKPLRMIKPLSLSFLTYTREELLSISCVEVNQPTSFDKNSKILSNGLYDERMGPIRIESKCKTCHLGYFDCPGHFGHIKFPEVLINPLHVDEVYKKLRKTCVSCLLEIFVEKCKGCSLRQPKFRKVNTKIFVEDIMIRPQKIRDFLRKVDEDVDKYFLEVLPVVPNKFRPINLMKNQIYQDPQNILLSRIVASIVSYNQELEELKELQSASSQDKLKNLRSLAEISSRDSRERKKKYIIGLGFRNYSTMSTLWTNLEEIKRILPAYDFEDDPIYLVEIMDLVDCVTNYYDSSTFAMDGVKAPKGIKQILEKKEGLFRKHVLGKRVNYAARSVISPDPNLETREIGIPLIFATKLTFPEPVAHFNYEKLRKAVINGPVYPGANHIEENGVTTNLLYISEEKRIAIANKLLVGKKVVHRHINENDFLLVNRQPTLHKQSIMAYKAKVLNLEKTIRLHYANCQSHNADFDGDEMNLHAMQCYLSKSEAKYIAMNDYNYKVQTTGNPIRGLVQDHIVMGAVLTMKDYFLVPSEFKYLLLVPFFKDKIFYSDWRSFSGSKISDKKSKQDLCYEVMPTILRPVKLYTGKQVLTSLLKSLNILITLEKPSKLEVEGHPEESTVLVKKGIFMTGMLDKNNLGSTRKGLVHLSGEIFGEFVYNNLLTVMSQVINRMLAMDGYTLRMDDLLITGEYEEKRKAIISGVKNKTDRLIRGYISEAEDFSIQEQQDDSISLGNKRSENVNKSNTRKAKK